MAVVIRLRREGKKKQPYYRIVATDSRFSRDGRFLEILGQYNPLPEEEKVNVDEERLIHWMRNGAKASDTVRSLFTRKGLWKDFVEKAKVVKADEMHDEEKVETISETTSEADTDQMSSQSDMAAEKEVEQ